VLYDVNGELFEFKCPGAYEYYVIYNRIFLEHFEMIHNTRVLANQLIQSADDLILAHIALAKKTANRGRLKSDIAKIQELYLTLNEMKKTVYMPRMKEENNYSK
jgi:ATP/maltotriose-dependent transcriptional regulator MalT